MSGLFLLAAALALCCAAVWLPSAFLGWITRRVIEFLTRED